MTNRDRKVLIDGLQKLSQDAADIAALLEGDEAEIVFSATNRNITPTILQTTRIPIFVIWECSSITIECILTRTKLSHHQTVNLGFLDAFAILPPCDIRNFIHANNQGFSLIIVFCWFHRFNKSYISTELVVVCLYLCYLNARIGKFAYKLTDFDLHYVAFVFS